MNFFTRCREVAGWQKGFVLLRHRSMIGGILVGIWIEANFVLAFVDAMFCQMQAPSQWISPKKRGA